MLPPKALEGAFGEGATMLQLLLLLLGLIVEDIDLGRSRKWQREGEMGEGLRWLTVQAGGTKVEEIKVFFVFLHFLKKINLWTKPYKYGAIKDGINYPNFCPHFRPVSLIRSTHRMTGSIVSLRGVSHTNYPDPDLCWTSSPSCSSSSPSQWVPILRIVWATATAEGVDATLIRGGKLLCFSNEGLEMVPTGPSVHPQRHCKQKTFINNKHTVIDLLLAPPTFITHFSASSELSN